MSEYITRVLLVEDEEDAREILSFYLDTVFDEVKIKLDQNFYPGSEIIIKNTGSGENIKEIKLNGKKSK